MIESRSRNSLAQPETTADSSVSSGLLQGGQVSRNPSVLYIHFYIFLPFPLPPPPSPSSSPSTRSSPVAALPFSPGVVRLPSHHVMTCRLSDLARGKAARFEPRNDRHRRPVEDEEKDRRTEAVAVRERDGEPGEVDASETTWPREASLLRTQYLRTSSPRRIGRSFSEFSRGPRVSRPQDRYSYERRSVLSYALPSALIALD